MFIKQLSIFVENKHGGLDSVLKALKEKDINIRALSLADTTNFGILRLIVSEPEKAKTTLWESGVFAKTTDVIAAYVDDETGGLATLIEPLTAAGLEVEYMYAFTSRKEGKALIVLKANDEEKAGEILTSCGIKTVDENDL